MAITAQASCRQCGTCCRKGGPALHREDGELLRQGVFAYQHLVAIRQGEPAYSPVSGRVEPAGRELVKINGRGGDWTCIFFVPEGAACAIYGQRPLECRLLKCWDPADLLGAVGRDTVTRFDLLSQGDPARQLIALHERECPAGQVAAAMADWRLDPEDPGPREALAELVRRDLAVRHQAVAGLGLPATVEFFVFGRPLFKQLAGFGVSLRERDASVDLVWPAVIPG